MYLDFVTYCIRADQGNITIVVFTILFLTTCSLVSLIRLASVTLALTRFKSSSEPLKCSTSFCTCCCCWHLYYSLQGFHFLSMFIDKILLYHNLPPMCSHCQAFVWGRTETHSIGLFQKPWLRYGRQARQPPEHCKDEQQLKQQQLQLLTGFVTSIKCVVRRMVRSLFREVSRSHMPRRASGSIPEVGSSSITTFDYWDKLVNIIIGIYSPTLLLPMRAMPRLTFLFMPPDKVVTFTFFLGSRFSIPMYLEPSSSASE